LEIQRFHITVWFGWPFWSFAQVWRSSPLQMADATDGAEHNYDTIGGVAKLSSSERYKTVMEVSVSH
jgi:hypothetical protein